MDKGKVNTAASEMGATGALQKVPRTAARRLENKIYLTFGIGCFHFASLRPTSEINRETYFNDLKEYLLSDKLVTKFEAVIDDNTTIYAEEKPGLITENISDSEIFYPYIDNCLVRFEIHIPKRIQKEYMLSWREPTTSENFLVEIDYAEDVPVAYVWLDADETSPSTAVSILWKHFKNSNPESKTIRFQMVGPSPFHTDFVVKRTKMDRLDISLKESRGYDGMTIVIPERIRTENIKELIRYRFTEEFSLFYEASIDSIRFHESFSSISEKIDKIIDSESFLNKIRRILIGGDPEVYDISIEIEKVMISLERLLANYKEKISYIEKSFGEIINKNKIDERISDVGSVPIERYLNIISILRDRHTSSRANYTVIISAVVGAVAALIATKLF
ncbi:hypothetical protein NKI38_10550 [Mesorhizobium sp. M0621]|uniref:hypothetical protein n=1 Tax=Mesorhizobium sp. M0621 TaxID=2956974 RepID=UPI00333939AD